MRLNIKSMRPAAGILTAGVAIVLMFGFILFGSTSVYAQLTGVQKLPANEHYTELAFDNHLNLPQDPTGQLQYIKFHIRNNDGRDLSYRYQLTSTSEAGFVKVLDNGKVTVARGSSATINQPFVLPKTAPRTKLAIVLIDQHQEINLWAGGSK